MPSYKEPYSFDLPENTLRNFNLQKTDYKYLTFYRSKKHSHNMNP